MRIILLFLLITSNTFAAPLFEVILREEGTQRPYYSKVELPDLKSDHSFDGAYFKIVKGKEDEAIAFNSSDTELKLRAATVYYHLSQARDFWVRHIKSKVAAKLPKMTVRIEITNQFDQHGQFAHDNKSQQFNNAVSIPEGKSPSWVPANRRRHWGKEIWYRPMKTILMSELESVAPNPLSEGLMALEDPLLEFTQGQIEQRFMEELFYPTFNSRPLFEDVVRFAGTFAIMKLIIYGSRFTDNLFIGKYYYLDTALVPEVSYHEYAHVILSEHLEMSHSTPVNEGMADYFAAVQSQTIKIYGKVPGYSNAASKDTQQERTYSHWDESNRYATADFTLSVLWDVREVLGPDQGDRVVYEARKYLSTSTSTISDGLLRALLKACEDKCDSPRRDKLKLYEAFIMKGF